MIQTARDMFKHMKIRTPDDYRRKLEETMAKRRSYGLPGVVIEVEAKVVAEVNNGRWTAECPCGGSVATDPAWGVAGCFGCGLWQMSVVFPEDANAIESLLAARPERHRNWTPGETADMLEDENAAMLKVRP